MGLGWDERDGPGETGRKLAVLVVAEPSVVGDAVMIVVQNESDLLIVDRVRPSVDIAAIASRSTPDARTTGTSALSVTAFSNDSRSP